MKMNYDYKTMFELQNIHYTEDNNILEFATTRDYVKASQALFDLGVSHKILSGTKKIEIIV